MQLCRVRHSVYFILFYFILSFERTHKNILQSVLEETHLRKRLGKDRAKSNNRTSLTSLPPSLPEPFSSSLLFQSWCKQPCCCALVPVSGQDRAHRLRSADRTAPRLLPPPPRVVRDAHLTVREKKTPRTVDNGYYNLMVLPRLVAAGRRDISSRRTDRTDGLVPRHCSAALANDLIPITQRMGRAACGFRGFWVPWIAVCVAAGSCRSRLRPS